MKHQYLFFVRYFKVCTLFCLLEHMSVFLDAKHVTRASVYTSSMIPEVVSTIEDQSPTTSYSYIIEPSPRIASEEEIHENEPITSAQGVASQDDPTQTSSVADVVSKDETDEVTNIEDATKTDESTKTESPPRKLSDFISESTYNTFNTIVIQTRIPLSVIGILTNTCNIIVFMNPKMRNATSKYLAAISFWQIAYILLAMISIAYGVIYGSGGKLYFYIAIYVNNYLGAVFMRTIYCLVSVVCFERMIAIVYPLKRQYLRLVNSPGLCVTITFVTVILFHTFSPLKHLVSHKINADGTVTYGLQRTEYDLETIQVFSLASLIIFVYLPLIGILTCNIILCVALKRQHVTRQNLQEVTDTSGRDIIERQTTLAILVSSFLFFFLSLPVTTNSVAGNIFSDYSYFTSNRYVFLFFQSLGSFCSLISFSIDIIAYATMSSKFRSILLRSCLPCIFKIKKKYRPTGQVPTVSYTESSFNRP